MSAPGLIARHAECMGCFYDVPLDGVCTCREYGDATCGHCRAERGPEHTCQDSGRDEEDGALDAADAANDEALLDRGGEW